jgi:hypothetical protein
MPHDKIKAATRQRMAKTGEPYSIARRAVINEHKQAVERAAKAAPAIPGRTHAELAARVGMMSMQTGGAMQAAMANMVRALEQAGRLNATIPNFTAFDRATTGFERAVTENVIRMVEQANRIADKVNPSIRDLTDFERTTMANVAKAVEQMDRISATNRAALDGIARAVEQVDRINDTIWHMGWV